MALSQNTLQRRKSIRAAHEHSSVFRAGNPPVRMQLANGNRIVPPTAAQKPPQPRDEVCHKAINNSPKRVQQMEEGSMSARAVQVAEQPHGDPTENTAVEQPTETSVDSPFSQMSITEQERERQPPQQQPPAANMMWGRLSTAEPGEIREESPGARRRGKLPMRDSPRPTTSVPEFGRIDQLLRSDVVPESPLFCTPNDTPGSSALSPESMAVVEVVQQLEARRDAEDGLYEPSQAGTPGQWLSHTAQQELDQEAEFLARNQILNDSRRRKSGSFSREKGGVPGSDILSAIPVEDIQMEDGPAASFRQQPQSPPRANRPASAAKRRSPEPHIDTPQKKQKRHVREEGLLQSWAYDSLKEKSKNERDNLLSNIHSLWGVPCHEALPRTLWLHNSKGRRVEPRDWAASKTLVPLRRLARLTQNKPASAVLALRRAISERTRTSPMTPPRIWVEADLARAIEIAGSSPEPLSQTLGRNEDFEDIEETLPDVLRRTAEPARRSFHQSSPEPEEVDSDSLGRTDQPLRSSFYQPSPEPAANDSDNSVTIAKVESASVSPTLSTVPIKIEATPPLTTAASRLLQARKSRDEVMQMTRDEFWDFHCEAEKLYRDAVKEKKKRINPSKPGCRELAALSREQLKQYYRDAKAIWELADEVWDMLAEQQSQQNAIVIDG